MSARETYGARIASMAPDGVAPVIRCLVELAAQLTADEDGQWSPSAEEAALVVCRRAAEAGEIQLGNMATAAALVAGHVTRADKMLREQSEDTTGIPAAILGCEDAMGAWMSAMDLGQAGNLARVAALVRTHVSVSADDYGRSVVTAPGRQITVTDEDGCEESITVESDEGRLQREAGRLRYCARPEVATALAWADATIAAHTAPLKAVADAWVAETSNMELQDRMEAVSKLPTEIRRTLMADRRLPKAMRRAAAVF